MVDSRFHARVGPFSLGELASIIGADMRSSDDSNLSLLDVAPLETARSGHLSFLDNRKYIKSFESTNASACIISPNYVKRAPLGMALLISSTPYKAYAMAARAFYPVLPPEPGIANSAVIGSSTTINDTSRVDPGVIIGNEVTIGKYCHIEPNAVIGNNVEIGDNSVIGACASLSHCIIGNSVRIYPGVRIGQDGFGFFPDPAGHVKVPQLGRVIIGDDVEVGANSTIDRGSGPDTIIGPGCWLDNQVQIAHNVELGKGCVIAAMAGVAGSSKLGDFVFLAGQVGVIGHLKVGSGAKVAGQSGVTRDIPPGSTVGGTPAVQIMDWHRQSVILSKLIDKDK